MMTNNERDTKFLGFARLLFEELPEYPDSSEFVYELQLALNDWTEAVEKLIAQRAYDLVYHVLETAEAHNLFAHDFYGYFSLDTEAKLTEIPDLTEWPPN
jgi:hypothetical protein